MHLNLRTPLALLMVAVMVLQGALPLAAQEGAPPPPAGVPPVPPAPPPPAAAPPAPTFKPEELDQLAAPIALYPDALVAQVLMASTYPLEVVEAARWAQDHPDLKDQALEDALQQQTWDPSVKSLTAFPQVLTMMNEKLGWTQKLGDAFLAQQKDVLDAVQRLRARAQAAGNLKSNEQQNVTVESPPVNGQNVTVEGAPVPVPVPAPAAPPPVIIIQPANPQVVYVPMYDPSVVYGPWPYPAYPPYYYYPPGYVWGTAILSFGIGLAVGYALWGGCNWGHGNVNVNVTNYNTFNRTNISNNNWQHNVDHRKGVHYRDASTQQRYNRGNQAGVQSRDAFRGRAEQGRQQIAHGEAREFKGPAGRQPDRSGRAAGQTRPAASQRAAGQTRPAAPQGGAGQARSAASQRNAGQTRPAAPQGGAGQARTQAPPQRAAAPAQTGAATRNPPAYQGVGNGQQTRAQSDRGHASRQSAAGSSRSGRASGNRGGKRR